MINLNWLKSQSGGWLPFSSVQLENVKSNGVYLIWHAGNPGRVVYVGQGDIASRIQAHRNRPDITAYGSHGMLHVTWANVPAHLMDGVERHLADRWSPLIGDAYPTASPIVVNSPW